MYDTQRQAYIVGFLKSGFMPGIHACGFPRLGKQAQKIVKPNLTSTVGFFINVSPSYRNRKLVNCHFKSKISFGKICY